MRVSDPVRTDLYCHDCDRNFVALLDMSVDGNHIILCPYCGHQHCRVIVAGVVTGERFDRRYERIDLDAENVWKADSLRRPASTVCQFLRDRWLNREDVQL